MNGLQFMALWSVVATVAIGVVDGQPIAHLMTISTALMVTGSVLAAIRGKFW